MKQKTTFLLGRSLFMGGVTLVISTCIRFSKYFSWNYFGVNFSLVLIGVILIITGFMIQKKVFKMNECDNIIADSSEVTHSKSVLPSNSRANFCTTCGTPITPNATICSKCGKQN
jgi:hypothetical protein